jgi:hypothetical protein
VWKRLHTVAESVRRRREPMKTVLAALFGLLVANLFAISGNWLTIRLGGEAFLSEQSPYATMVVLITFLWTAASVALGGYVVARLHNTRGALSVFIVLELMLGAGMLAEFWSSAASWYDTVAVLFVIPCAVLGASLLRPRWLTRNARNTG